MRRETLDILRCPYCSGTLEIDSSSMSRCQADDVESGILVCQCSTFPIVAGIPVMHGHESASSALAHLHDDRPDLARRSVLAQGPEQAARLDEVAAFTTATFRDAVNALGPTLEAGYFVYRFSDPSYVVAHALIRAVAGTVLRDGGRAIDMCGGSGHLTRAMMDLSSPPPVLADLYFAKLWLARRFTAPGCEAVCCDGNSPLPFARGAFRYAMCADAFMFIWTKRAFVGEMQRLVDDGSGHGAAVISHTHNLLEWSPSHGQPLSPDGYRDLFEACEPRVFAESGLFADVVRGGPLDLSRHDSAEALARDPALTLIATRDGHVFKRHTLQSAPGAPGELRVNPLYIAEADGSRVRLRLQFPSEYYEEEFGACREYLPAEVLVDQASLDALVEGRLPQELAELRHRRVILELPKRYY